jgi:hypothetical protein
VFCIVSTLPTPPLPPQQKKSAHVHILYHLIFFAAAHMEPHHSEPLRWSGGVDSARERGDTSDAVPRLSPRRV